MPKKKKSRFRKEDDTVVWTLSDGEEIAMSWEEFKDMVKSKEYVALPKREFEAYYKRMKMPKDAREYHKNAKKKKKRSTRKEAG